MFISVLSPDSSRKFEDDQRLLSNKVRSGNSNNSWVWYYDLSIVLYQRGRYSFKPLYFTGNYGNLNHHILLSIMTYITCNCGGQNCHILQSVVACITCYCGSLNRHILVKIAAVFISSMLLMNCFILNYSNLYLIYYPISKPTL